MKKIPIPADTNDEKLLKLKRRRIRRRRLVRFQWNVIIVLTFFGLFSYLTNPFTKYSAVKDPFTIVRESGEFVTEKKGKLYVLESQPFRTVGSFKALWHILVNHFNGGGKKTKATDLEGIIDEIHQLRFDPYEPFLISGDHFSMLYPRSLGVFYHSTLDARTARSQDDWDRRQETYLKTTVYALQTFDKSKRLSTTIIPIGPDVVTLSNFFDPPSDTMYSLLFALSTLRSEKELSIVYPYTRIDGKSYPLGTEYAAEKLLEQYMPSLRRQFLGYISYITDPDTGLIKKSIYLSSMKDSVRRQSSFYDNVIMWKTTELAQQLGVIPKDQPALDSLKRKIIDTYWLPQEGYFLEEDTLAARNAKHYSSDWLIAFTSKFLDPTIPSEREYFLRSIDFIQQQGLDRPFALKYEPESQKNKLYWALKFGDKTYGTKAIWSNLGMEYIKLLTVLYQTNCNSLFLTEAEYQIKNYERNIVKYRGYPEVYNGQGNMYQTFFYTSILRTGWVVSFEQARSLFNYTMSKKDQFCSQENTPRLPIDNNEPYL